MSRRPVDDPAWMNYYRLMMAAALASLIVGQDEMWQRAAAAVALWIHAQMFGYGVAVRNRREAAKR